MKTVVIVQARMGSTRLPGKVMQDIVGTPMIGVLLDRVAKARKVDEVVVATSEDAKNDPLAEYVTHLGYGVFRGSENDVLDRFVRAAQQAGATTVVRITGDCPLVDPALVDEVISAFESADVDYASNINPPTYPDGLDIEVFRTSALETAHREATATPDREHVTPYLRTSPQFTRHNISHDEDRSAERWTVDEPEDLGVARAVFEHFRPRRDFTWREVLSFRDQHPELFMKNQQFARNEGLTLGTGQKLYSRAKRIIPGGNMMLSKRPEMYLPGAWPAYFSKAKDCRVWDLDGNEFIDMSLMGIGTNTLGYGHPEVDDAVRAVIDAGNMSTLNCPEEVALAEKLLELNPWGDMVRLARTGGELNAIAIRIARAASGRDLVAFCGYHGWPDWYLAANLGDEKTLAGHLLPGLEPKGVPQHLRGSVLPFNYNDFAELEKLVRDHAVGAIVMEVSRSAGPKPGFLESVRKLATEKGIVLMFDECTSGFRQTYGGLHQLFGVEPDMAMYSKALGNGYAISAVVGKREIMEAAQGTFISSTFWTERIGPSAAVKVLDVMKREKSWERITETGRGIMKRWEELGTRHGLRIGVSGLPALAGFSLPGQDALKYKTYITQEMLKKGYLAATSVYVCIAHTPQVVDRYFDALDPIFGTIAACENGKANIDALLEGPVCHTGFRRLA